MAGGLSDEVDEKSKEFQQFRQSVGPEKFDAFQAKYSWLDAGKFTPHAAPATVFLQYATQEDFLTPERAHAYAAIVSEPKQFKLYDAPHALNAEARRDRIVFVVEQLSLKPAPSPAQIAAIPKLPQAPSPATRWGVAMSSRAELRNIHCRITDNPEVNPNSLLS
jgi:hypothetical protein